MIDSSLDIATKLAVLIESHGIPFEHIVVGGGGALVCMGLRESTADLNLWLNEESFNKLAVRQNIIVHPMVDVAFQYQPEEGKDIGEEQIWIRKRNLYFDIANEEGIQVFDPLTLMVQKRGGFARVERPKAKRDQDIIDIRLLNDLLAEKNKVKAA